MLALSPVISNEGLLGQGWEVLRTCKNLPPVGTSKLNHWGGLMSFPSASICIKALVAFPPVSVLLEWVDSDSYYWIVSIVFCVLYLILHFWFQPWPVHTVYQSTKCHWEDGQYCCVKNKFSWPERIFGNLKPSSCVWHTLIGKVTGAELVFKQLSILLVLGVYDWTEELGRW